MVAQKIGYAATQKVTNKTADYVSTEIVNRLMPLAAKVKTLVLRP